MFNDRLKYLRESRGLSQRKLAALTGLKQSRISNYELGIREPDFETEELFADFFNVDLNFLRGKVAEESYIINRTDLNLIFDDLIEGLKEGSLTFSGISIEDEGTIELLINSLEHARLIARIEAKKLKNSIKNNRIDN